MLDGAVDVKTAVTIVLDSTAVLSEILNKMLREIVEG